MLTDSGCSWLASAFAWAKADLTPSAAQCALLKSDGDATSVFFESALLRSASLGEFIFLVTKRDGLAEQLDWDVHRLSRVAILADTAPSSERIEAVKLNELGPRG